MSRDRVIHDTFTLERTFDAPPERVFAALSDAAFKARWFSGPHDAWTEIERSFDFRVGGRERVAGRHAIGLTSIFDAVYFDIVPNERVVYAYEMTVNGRKISTSLATFEILPDGARTRLVLTEQGAYFADPEMDEYAPNGPAASRVEGTKGLLDRMVAVVSG